MAKRPTKNQGTKQRRGGPNPGAMARKELANLPWTSQDLGFERGRFPREIEGVGFAIAAVRQFILRLKSANPEEAKTLRTAAGWPEGNPTTPAEQTEEYASGGTRLNSPEKSGYAAARHVSDLGRWLGEATPENLRQLASFLDARPIEPSPRLCRNLLPRPADPVGQVAWMIVARMWAFESPESPPDKVVVGTEYTPIQVQPRKPPTLEECRRLLERASPDLIEKMRAEIAPSIDPTTLRKAFNQIYGVKRAAGARKK